MILSNKHRYSLQRALQLFLSPFFTFFSFFLPKKNIIVLTSSLNNEFSDNSRALFIYLYKKFPENVYFVLNDEFLREQLNKKYNNKFISNTKFKDIFFILRARHWFCSALELPAPGIFQRFQRTVIHLGHGMLYKRVGLRERKVSLYKKVYYFFTISNFSYTISTSNFFLKEISQGFGLSKKRILLIPQPKTALISCPASNPNPLFSDPNSTHILHAPTWRPYADVNLFPFDDLNFLVLEGFLEKNNIHLWLRVHPRFEQDIDVTILKTKNIHLFSAKQYKEVNQYLVYFDALITDYSSIYFDFLTLERPVLFFDYDFEEYNQKVGVIDDYNQIKSTGSTTSQNQFLAQLSMIKNGDFDLTKVRQANKLANYNISNDKILEHVVERIFK